MSPQRQASRPGLLPHSNIQDIFLRTNAVLTIVLNRILQMCEELRNTWDLRIYL
jgi:hypothetical protein